jgi:hypothetical protein
MDIAHLQENSIVTRREILASASAALAANAATSRFAAGLDAAPVDDGPTVDSLINLAENGTEQPYYGRLLGVYLARHGSIARHNDDGTVSIYAPEPPGSAWRKWTIRDANRPVGVDVAKYFRAANRGEDFPAGVPLEMLPKD